MTLRAPLPSAYKCVNSCQFGRRPSFHGRASCLSQSNLTLSRSIFTFRGADAAIAFAAAPKQDPFPPHQGLTASPFSSSRTFRTISKDTMAQPSAIDQLVQRVEGLTLAGLAQKYPSTHPEYNSLDLYRAHLSDALSKISGVDTSIIFPVVMWTQSLEKGDFVVAVPALRIKGSKPDLLAQEWAAKVRYMSMETKQCSL